MSKDPFGLRTGGDPNYAAARKKRRETFQARMQKQVEKLSKKKKYDLGPDLLDLFDDVLNRASGGKMPKRKK